MATFLFIFCLSTLTTSVLAFSHGAPSQLCGSPLGRPVHNDTLPQGTCSPFVVALNSTLYSPNVPINITIHGNGRMFKGFLLTADTTTGLFDGTCLNTSTDAKAVPNCGMTHSNSTYKTSVNLLWYPPTLVHVGNIQFKLVAVQDFKTYWSDIRSDVIRPNPGKYYSLRDVWELGFFNKEAENAMNRSPTMGFHNFAGISQMQNNQRQNGRQLA